MKTEIRLESSAWCDFVFANKNKTYGAYELRQSSGKRHLLAFLIVAVFMGGVVALAGLLRTVHPAVERDRMKLVNVITDLNLTEEPVQKQTVQPDVAPPPPLKSTIRYTPPVITDDPLVTEKDVMRSQDDLKESPLQISIIDHQGTDAPGAVDPADLVNHGAVTEAPAEQVYHGVEQMPDFPGGLGEMSKYMAKNLKYPAIAAEAGIQGRVILRFVVNKTGEIEKVEILKGFDPACDKEAIRVVQSMPRWIPGKQNGRNVPVYFTLPVVFRLQ